MGLTSSQTIKKLLDRSVTRVLQETDAKMEQERRRAVEEGHAFERLKEGETEVDREMGSFLL